MEKECKWCRKGKGFCVPFLYHPVDRDGNIIDEILEQEKDLE